MHYRPAMTDMARYDKYILINTRAAFLFLFLYWYDKGEQPSHVRSVWERRQLLDADSQNNCKAPRYQLITLINTAFLLCRRWLVSSALMLLTGNLSPFQLKMRRRAPPEFMRCAIKVDSQLFSNRALHDSFVKVLLSSLLFVLSLWYLLLFNTAA